MNSANSENSNSTTADLLTEEVLYNIIIDDEYDFSSERQGQTADGEGAHERPYFDLADDALCLEPSATADAAFGLDSAPAVSTADFADYAIGSGQNYETSSQSVLKDLEFISLNENPMEEANWRGYDGDSEKGAFEEPEGHLGSLESVSATLGGSAQETDAGKKPPPATAASLSRKGHSHPLSASYDDLKKNPFLKLINSRKFPVSCPLCNARVVNMSDHLSKKHTNLDRLERKQVMDRIRQSFYELNGRELEVEASEFSHGILSLHKSTSGLALKRERRPAIATGLSGTVVLVSGNGGGGKKSVRCPICRDDKAYKNISDHFIKVHHLVTGDQRKPYLKELKQSGGREPVTAASTAESSSAAAAIVAYEAPAGGFPDPVLADNEVSDHNDAAEAVMRKRKFSKSKAPADYEPNESHSESEAPPLDMALQHELRHKRSDPEVLRRMSQFEMDKRYMDAKFYCHSSPHASNSSLSSLSDDKSATSAGAASRQFRSFDLGFQNDLADLPEPTGAFNSSAFSTTIAAAGFYESKRLKSIHSFGSELADLLPAVDLANGDVSSGRGCFSPSEPGNEEESSKEVSLNDSYYKTIQYNPGPAAAAYPVSQTSAGGDGGIVDGDNYSTLQSQSTEAAAPLSTESLLGRFIQVEERVNKTIHLFRNFTEEFSRQVQYLGNEMRVANDELRYLRAMIINKSGGAGAGGGRPATVEAKSVSRFTVNPSSIVPEPLSAFNSHQAPPPTQM